VAGVVGQAGALGVRAVCVISAGFAETGGQGRALQDELRLRARAAGVRLIGPNCMGQLNGGPEPRFNATFSAAFPPPGHLSFVPQSGGLGLAALALLNGPSLGVSGFVSVGSTADLTPNDLLLVLGRGSRHSRRAGLPGVGARPAPVRPDRAADLPGTSRWWR